MLQNHVKQELKNYYQMVQNRNKEGESKWQELKLLELQEKDIKK